MGIKKKMLKNGQNPILSLILPMLFDQKESTLPGFIDIHVCYYIHGERRLIILVDMKEDNKEFYTSHKDFKGTEDTSELGVSVYLYQIPEEYKEDFENLIHERFHKISKDLQDRIIRNDETPDHALEHFFHVFTILEPELSKMEDYMGIRSLNRPIPSDDKIGTVLKRIRDGKDTLNWDLPRLSKKDQQRIGETVDAFKDVLLEGRSFLQVVQRNMTDYAMASGTKDKDELVTILVTVYMGLLKAFGMGEALEILMKAVKKFRSNVEEEMCGESDTDYTVKRHEVDQSKSIEDMLKDFDKFMNLRQGGSHGRKN